MRASVVIPTYRRRAFLPDCLASVSGQRGLRDYVSEVILVDDDPDLSALGVWLDFKDAFPVKLRYIPTLGVGCSGARNSGARAAEEDIVIFLDDDCIADPFFAHYVMRAFAEHDADVVACRIISRPY